MRWSAVACAVGVVAIGCPPASAQVFHSSAGDVAVETVAKNLDHPWAIAFLPAGRMLVTGGQEGDGPRMIEVLRYGLHRDVAGGGMENLRAGGRAADRNDPDCACYR